MKPRREAAQNRYSVVTIDRIPPSVNSYVRHTRRGIHYTDPRAKAFKDYLALQCRSTIPAYGIEFEVEISIMLAKGQKGDVDNFPKLILDTLAKCGMFRNAKTGKPMSDAHVTRLTISKERGEHSRTTIEIIGVVGV